MDVSRAVKNLRGHWKQIRGHMRKLLGAHSSHLVRLFADVINWKTAQFDINYRLSVTFPGFGTIGVMCNEIYLAVNAQINVP